MPRSDLHCIAVNVTAASEDGNGEASWEIWCSECNAEVYVDTYKKLREAVDYVRRVEANKGRASSATAATNTNASKSSTQKPSSKSGSKYVCRYWAKVIQTIQIKCLLEFPSGTNYVHDGASYFGPEFD